MQLHTTPTPVGVLDDLIDRIVAAGPGSRLGAVVSRAYLKRELMEGVLDRTERTSWLGGQVLTFEELFNHYTNLLPGRPALTYAQVRQLVGELIREMHEESGGRWFRGQVIQYRVSQATLRSLTRMLLELEPTALGLAELQDRLLGSSPTEEMTARAQEVTELYRRYRERLEENGYLGPKGQQLRAADAAAELEPPHGLDHFLVLGVDGRMPTAAPIRWIEAVEAHPDVREVEVFLTLPDEPHESAWLTHANQGLFEHWVEGGGQRTLRDFEAADRPESLRVLAERPFDYRFEAAATGDEVRGVRLPDEQLEAEWVAAEAKRLVLEEDVPVDEIAVVVRNLSERVEEFEESFDKVGLPVVSSREIRLLEVPAVKALLLVYRLVAEDWDTADMIALADSPYLAPNLNASLVRTARQMAEPPSTHGEWLERFERLSAMEETVRGGWSTEDVEAMTAEFEAFGEALSELLDAEQEAPTASSWVETLVEAVETFELEERIYGVGAEVEAAERLQLARLDLDGLNELLHAANDWLRGREVAGLEDVAVPAGSWYEELEEIARQNRIRVSAYPRHGVHLLTPSQAIYRSWQVVMVAGLNDGAFPADVDLDEHSLTEEERRAIRLPTRPIREARERLLFQGAVAAGREQVLFTAPAADEHGKALVTSPFLTHMDVRLEGFELEDVAAHQLLPERAEDLRSARDLDLVGAHRYREVVANEQREDGETRYLLEEDPLVRAWLVRPGTGRALEAWAVEGFRYRLEEILQHHPWQQQDLFDEIPPFGEFAGLFRPEQVPEWIREETATFSPSDFDAYQKCHFRFFLSKVVGLDRAVEQDGHSEAGAFGSLQHEILETFYGRMFEEGRLPPTSRDELDQGVELLREVAEQVVRDQPGTVHPELRHLDLEVSLTTLESFVRWDLRRMLRIEQNPDHPELRRRVVTLERFFGSEDQPIPAEALDERFRLRGKVDRIEEIDDPRLAPEYRAANGSLILADYKTGKWARHPSPDQFLDGKELQLPLYSYLVREHMERYGEPRHIFGFGVLATARPDKSGLLAVRQVQTDGDGTVRLAPDDRLGGNPVARAEQTAVRVCARRVKEMRAGRFSPQPDRKTWGCPLGSNCCQRRHGGSTGTSKRFELPVQIDGETLDELEQAREAGDE